MSNDRCEGLSPTAANLINDLKENNITGAQKELGKAWLTMRPQEFNSLIQDMENCNKDLSVTRSADSKQVKVELKDGFLDIPPLGIELGGMRSTLLNTEEFNQQQAKPLAVFDRGFINRTIGGVARTVEK